MSVSAQISSSRCQSLRVAGQAGDFQSDHQPGVTHAHLGHECLEALAICRRSAGLSQVAVDDHDAIGMPAECDGALPESVLTLGALGVFQDLTRRGLTDVEIRAPFQVPGVLPSACRLA